MGWINLYRPKAGGYPWGNIIEVAVTLDSLFEFHMKLPVILLRKKAVFITVIEGKYFILK